MKTERALLIAILCLILTTVLLAVFMYQLAKAAKGVESEIDSFSFWKKKIIIDEQSE